jgi:hypothetical protein
MDPDMLAVFRLEFEVSAGGTPHGASDGGVLVFEIEISMARGMELEIGDLTFDPEVKEALFESGLDLPGDGGYGVCFALFNHGVSIGNFSWGRQ